MRLLVDVGNSRIKWARLDDGKLEAGSHLERAEPLEDLLNTAWSAIEAPSEVLICSVAGDSFDPRMARWILDHWGLRPEWFRVGPEALGLVNGYADYTQLGSDRWAAMLGARSVHAGPLGVIDCGTAVTLDVVDADGRHLGGLILPGLALMQRSLLTGTARIREAAPLPRAILGRSTAECVASGTGFGLAGALERCVEEVDRLRDGLVWIATGGSWPQLEPMVPRRIHYDADLVLRGLARMSQHSEESH